MENYLAERRIGTLVASKYRLSRLLGTGGMGAVYAATHEFTKREVAVKLIHETLHPSASLRKRFIREAQAPSAIGHPGIVDVLDGGSDDDGCLYVVLEMLHGHTMGEWATGVPLPDLINVTVQLLEALGAAHDAGFVHRDIKPENVFLVATKDGGLQVKLLDFGVAGLRDSESQETKLTKTGTVLGTPLFMSPEQAKGNVVDHRSDLWSVGAVLYDALTGQPPYVGDTYNALIISIVTREHIPLSRLRPDLPRRLLEVIERALRKDLDARWQSAQDMVNALRDLAVECEGLDSSPPQNSDVHTAETAAERPMSRRAPQPPHATTGVPHAPGTAVARSYVDSVSPVPPAALAASRRTTVETPASRVQCPAAAHAHGPGASAIRGRTPDDEQSSAAPWMIAAAAAMVATGLVVAWAATDRGPTPELAAAIVGDLPRVTASGASSEVYPPAEATSLRPAGAAHAQLVGTAAVAEAPLATPTGPVASLAERGELAAKTNEHAAAVPLGSSDLGAALNGLQDDLQNCYQNFVTQTMTSGKAVPAKVTFSVVLHVGPEGRMRQVEINGSGDSEVKECLSSHLQSLRFRATGEPAKLRFPAMFEPEVVSR